jgi:SAM-dependent methyltransferase
MHPSALKSGKQFFEKYAIRGSIVEIGSCVVGGGSLRDVSPAGCKYLGLDICEGPGVDVAMPDPYSFPILDGCADCVVCSSVFEHVEFFWLTFLEMVRVVKVGGLIYANAPSNGIVHGYPVDCWRFYPDAGQALAKWALRSGLPVEVVETWIGPPDGADSARWEDWVCVWRKL